MSDIVTTPEPPYYAAILLSIRTDGDGDAYSQMAARMDELAALQPGYIGMEFARDGLGIAICYWDNLAAIRAWKANIEHLKAQRLGREKWYSKYQIRICKVEEDYGYG